MGYNSKNYTEQGGEKTVIGGELEIVEGGKLKLSTGSIVEGVVTPAAKQDDSTATTVAGLVGDFNALLAKLRSAGFIATT